MGFFKLDSLLDHFSSFIEAKIDIVKIEVREEAAKALSGLMVGLTLAGLAYFFIMFVSIAAGYYFGTLLNSFSLGFLIIAGFYFLLLLTLYLLRKQLGLRELFDKKLAKWLKTDK